MYFAEGLGDPEGPVVLTDGSWLVVEMTPDRGCVTHISRDGKNKRVLAKTGRPNGLAVDRDGFIWVAESLKPSLIKLSMDGKTEVFLTECHGEEFIFPNDLAFGPDGKLYMTDSGFFVEDFVKDGKVRGDYRELSYDGRVYVIDTVTKKIARIDKGIKFTNGIAFGPGGDLYVNETITGMVYRYRWSAGKVTGGREAFGNVLIEEEYKDIRGPDGMKFGADGNLYCTVYGQGDITVLGPDGDVLKRIRTEGSKPTNCAFGLPGDTKLYVTEVELGALEVLDAGTEGLPLYK
jgi:gluconolactonase